MFAEEATVAPVTAVVELMDVFFTCTITGDNTLMHDVIWTIDDIVYGDSMILNVGALVATLNFEDITVDYNNIAVSTYMFNYVSW